MLKASDENEPGDYMYVDIQVCDSALASESSERPRRVEEPWRAREVAGYGREGQIDTTLTPPGTQYGATLSKAGKVNPRNMRYLQSSAHPCNA
jgi:hypothetical protein